MFCTYKHVQTTVLKPDNVLFNMFESSLTSTSSLLSSFGNKDAALLN